MSTGRSDGRRERGIAVVTALMTLLAGYLGYPRASLAMETVHGLFAENT
ncbi:hypothetical protein [Nonomuraea lactucae]|nr:hypothetical protein [Nonomuraea lactucae]